MSDNIEAAFRELRNAWFNRVLFRQSHERAWESEEEENSRDEDNAKTKCTYDIQTQMIIDGMLKSPHRIHPRCQADLYRSDE